MLDIKLIRENPDLVKNNLKKRNDPQKLKLLEDLLKVDTEWRKLQTEINKMRQKRNQLSIEVAKLKKSGKTTKKQLTEAKKVDSLIEKNEQKLTELETKEKSLLIQIPNLLHENVPIGKDDKENVEIRRWGQPPKFDFKPKDHLTILTDLGLIDSERAAKATGAGFFYLKNDLALLDFALQRYALDVLRKMGFTIIEPPFMVNRKSYEGMIANPFDFAEASYKIEGEELYLIPTAEYPIGAMFTDEVFTEKDLPLKICGISPSFRREVGTHGKYQRGLYRMHQFNKVEQFIFCTPEQSWKLLEELQRNAEILHQGLGLHFRVVTVCSGDTSAKYAKTYDTEVWMADGQFREVGSCSSATDYQARRLGIRFKEGEGKPVKGFVHTLNNTALATSRSMIAIIEQFQQKDGSVVIPKVLRPYMFGIEKLEKK